MTRALLFCACAVLAVGQKVLPNQASNAKVGLVATVITDHKEMAALLGVDPGEDFLVVKLRVVPQTPDKLRMSMDDFTLINRQNGERSGAINPASLSGTATLVVTGHDGKGTYTNGMGMPVPIGGVGGTVQRRAKNIGDAPEASDVVKVTSGKDAPADPRMEAVAAALQAKVFADQDSEKPAEGLVYFRLQGTKLQAKNLGLIYAGPGGRLALDFK